MDYYVGIGLEKSTEAKKRKRLLLTSVFVNLGSLGFFKYYNFFLENFVESFKFFGMEIGGSSLNIILPVGISFYTFQTLSYSFDIYNGKLKHTNDFVAFSAFVSFFPQLVAGPIERAKHLLPQFKKSRHFDYNLATDGLRQILWGLFKKVVIADNCAVFVNEIFANSTEMNTAALILGAVFFAFQIYGDFSGYSDIAIGTSRLFGFDLMQNFNFPNFSRDIAEFWRRWHISLSTWFRDYLYIPLGGSQGSSFMKIRNIFIIFLVSGFWHGANWTYIVWGLINALFFLPLLLVNRNRKNLDIVAKGKHLPSVKESLAILSTFVITVFAWIFFRADSVPHAFDYISSIFSKPFIWVPNLSDKSRMLGTTLLIVIFMVIEWIGRDGKYAIESIQLNTSRR